MAERCPAGSLGFQPDGLSSRRLGRRSRPVTFLPVCTLPLDGPLDFFGTAEKLPIKVVIARVERSEAKVLTFADCKSDTAFVGLYQKRT